MMARVSDAFGVVGRDMSVVHEFRARDVTPTLHYLTRGVDFIHSRWTNDDDDDARRRRRTTAVPSADIGETRSRGFVSESSSEIDDDDDDDDAWTTTEFNSARIDECRRRGRRDDVVRDVLHAPIGANARGGVCADAVRGGVRG